MIVLVANLLLQQSVALVFLSVLAHITRILCLRPRVVHDLSLFFFCLSISSNFPAASDLRLVIGRENTGSEILRVQDADLTFVDEDKQQTL